MLDGAEDRPRGPGPSVLCWRTAAPDGSVWHSEVLQTLQGSFRPATTARKPHARPKVSPGDLQQSDRERGKREGKRRREGLEAGRGTVFVSSD